MLSQKTMKVIVRRDLLPLTRPPSLLRARLTVRLVDDARRTVAHLGSVFEPEPGYAWRGLVLEQRRRVWDAFRLACGHLDLADETCAHLVAELEARVPELTPAERDELRGLSIPHSGSA
jgi:hypothetical protein